MSKLIVGSDPVVYSPPTWIPSSLICWINQNILMDIRDFQILQTLASAALASMTLAISVYFAWTNPHLFWIVSTVYLGTYLVMMGPFILAMHNLTHRKIFTEKAKWIRHAAVWLIGPLFGQTPNSYFSHHIGMHHPEGNGAADRSSTIHYQRDSIKDFLRYLLRFLVRGAYDLAIYLKAKGKRRFLKKLILGEGFYFCVLVGLTAYAWLPTIVVFWIPLVISRVAMMVGNWAQHAFVDPQCPDDPYKNSITCIDTRYNKICFNDGYHIAHHQRPSLHWLELPTEFSKNQSLYLKKGAVVFKHIDFFTIWWWLMLKRYDFLAKHYVGADPTPPSPDRLGKIANFLKSRTQIIPL